MAWLVYEWTIRKKNFCLEVYSKLAERKPEPQTTEEHVQ